MFSLGGLYCFILRGHKTQWICQWTRNNGKLQQGMEVTWAECQDC